MKRVFSIVMVCVLCLSMFTVFAPKASAQGPVGYWKFDEGSGTVASDRSGNGNTGTLNGPTWVAGISGSALSFDGSDDYVSIPDSSSLDISGNQISIEFWMKPTVNLPDISDNRIIFDKGNAYTACMIGTAHGTHPGACQANLPFFGSIPSTTNSWTSGTWYHMAITYDGSNMRMYVNGKLENTGPATGNVQSSGYPLSIGSYCLGTQNFFKGILNEFVIYDYARTGEQILSDYSSLSRSPVGHWKFDEGSGSIAHDSSGNGNDGTVNGAGWTAGISNGALQFDGINNYVGIPSSPSLTLSGNKVSLELWIKPTVTLNSGLASRINIMDKGDAYGFQMEANDARINFFVNIGYADQWLGSTTSDWKAGTWYLIAGTYDGTNERIYVNGALENTKSLSGTLSGISEPLSIGSYCYGTMNFFPGAIDEVKIYNYARTSEEIQSDYAQGGAPAHPRILGMDWSWPPGSPWERPFSFPSGTAFTLKGFLEEHGFSVDVSSEVFGSNPITLGGLLAYDAIVLPQVFFDVPGNLAYESLFEQYVNQGGGLVFLGQAAVPQWTLDEQLGFHFVTIQWWNYYVDARIMDPSHPIMSGISELPKAGGVFVDWDTLIADSPLPPNTAVLARSVGSGGMYDPDNVIALIAFQHGQGKVVAGPLDGMIRPYGPTNVDGFNVVSEPVIENKLLINAINWVARAQRRFSPTVDGYGFRNKISAGKVSYWDALSALSSSTWAQSIPIEYWPLLAWLSVEVQNSLTLGNCFGMSYTAKYYYENPSLFETKYPGYANLHAVGMDVASPEIIVNQFPGQVVIPPYFFNLIMTMLGLKSTNEEMQWLMTQCDNYHVVPLYLIGTFQNTNSPLVHCVLVYNYAPSPDGNRLDLSIYDSNDMLSPQNSLSFSGSTYYLTLEKNTQGNFVVSPTGNPNDITKWYNLNQIGCGEYVSVDWSKVSSYLNDLLQLIANTLALSGNKHITLTGSNNVVIITGGDDTIDATQATATTVIKTGAGNDIINLGGGNNIVIETAGGNDIITAGNGDNTITITGNGNYQITTGSGKDQIQITGDGNNIIKAGNGDNTVTVSGKGNNQITTGSGNDVVVAGNGGNIIKTGAGNDSITVGNGNNNIDGGLGYDVCIHGTGHNTILNCEKT